MIFGSLYTAVTGRSSKWPKLRAAHLAANPRCVCCSQLADTCHHIRPVHVAPALELDTANLASVCESCHYCIGHLCRWQLWNDRFWQCVGEINRGRRGPVGES